MSQNMIDNLPEPKDAAPLFVNEPWLIDDSIFKYGEEWKREPETEEDNVRIYVPLDVNRQAIFRRLDTIISHYECSTEENEFDFRSDVYMLINQIRIYDQFWLERTNEKNGEHSQIGITLVKEFLERLDSIPDGGAELFPWEIMDELKKEFGVEYVSAYWD